MPDSWPEHARHIPPGRIASAPYNFVPLPKTVIPAVDDPKDLPDHDRYGSEAQNDTYRYTGHFEVALETKSPLYIRGPLTVAEFQEQDQEQQNNIAYDQRVRNKPEFFYTRDASQPVIPGSSLRGMLRQLLEIVSFGKLDRISTKKLFYRTVDDTSVGKAYNRRTFETHQNVQADDCNPAEGYKARVRGGHFRIRKDGTYWIEPCEVARLEVTALDGITNAERDPYGGNGPNATPKWNFQHQRIWVNLESEARWHCFKEQRKHNGQLRHPLLYLYFRKASNPLLNQNNPKDGRVGGTLVLTGPMQNKHLAFVFLDRKNGAEDSFEVPNNPQEPDINERLVDLFHDKDQITQWQRSAFPKGKPTGGTPRKQSGFLRDNEPVFYLEENGKLSFFGRAQLFRLPYEHTVKDMIPEPLRQPTDVDFADALFGYVRSAKEVRDAKQGSKRRAYAGRVVISNAHLTKLPNDKESPFLDTFTPKILASPKPTCFQHYLVQSPSNTSKKELQHYDCTPEDDTVIRGHKLYWPQGTQTEQDAVTSKIQFAPGDPDTQKNNTTLNPNTKQYTRLTPVRPNASFKFWVGFENLSDVELGALCWILQPQDDQGNELVHRLGMGKPLGLGSVKLQAKLHLDHRPTRYQSLFNGSSWDTPANSGDRANFAEKFEQHMLKRLCESKQLSLKNGDADASQFKDLERVRTLLLMMRWPGFPAVPPESNVSNYHSNTNMVLKQNAQGIARPNTRYMSIRLPHGYKKTKGGGQRQHFENEYRDRPVLPHPLTFIEPPKSKPQQGQHPEPPTEPTPEDLKTLQRGEVVTIRQEGAYGFIRPDEDSWKPAGGEVFVHINQVSGSGSLHLGLHVSYYLSPGRKEGQWQANEVQIETEDTPMAGSGLTETPLLEPEAPPQKPTLAPVPKDFEAGTIADTRMRKNKVHYGIEMAQGERLKYVVAFGQAQGLNNNDPVVFQRDPNDPARAINVRKR